MAAGLSSEAIIAAATAVASRNGFAGMSLRAVATELGVSPTAIYHHVSGKDELIDAVADAFVARILEAPLPSDPLMRVRQLAHRMRQVGLQHPGLLSAVVGHVPTQIPSPQAGYAEEVMSALVDAGASEAMAVLLYSVIVRLCLGDVVAETNLRAPSRVPLDERLRAHSEQDLYPRVAKMVAGTQLSSDRSFDEQLDVVLAGLSAGTGRRR